MNDREGGSSSYRYEVQQESQKLLYFQSKLYHLTVENSIEARSCHVIYDRDREKRWCGAASKETFFVFVFSWDWRKSNLRGA